MPEQSSAEAPPSHDRTRRPTASPYSARPWTTSATSRSSPTSTTASRPWPTASSRSPAPSTRRKCRRRCSTRWTSSASAGSRSRPRRCGSSTRPPTAQTYHLHLIDTPGHVDFSYEVSRSLAACEGALLVVDAAQGVEAQTVANTYLAIENGLELIPVINKVDLPGAEPERVAGRDRRPARRRPRGSAADLGQDRRGGGRGAGGDRRADPAAEGRARGADPGADLRLRVRPVPRRDRLRADGRRLLPQARADPRDAERDRGRDRRHRLLPPGDDRRAGDGRGRRRLPDHRHQGRRQAAGRRHADRARAEPAAEPLEGYREVRPMVFCGLFPIDTDRYEDLRDALEKLALNDAALSWEPETSEALGFGFRCGFLGLLHMEIVRERLEREYDLDLLATTPERALRGPPDQRRARSRSAARPTCPTRARSRRSKSPTSAPRSSPRPSRSAR